MTSEATAAHAPRPFTVRHEGVTLVGYRGGRGRPLVLCPGLNTTQAELSELAGELRRHVELVTFDLRGHGLSSAAGDYSLDAFGGDLAAVLAATGPWPAPPVLVGYSMGADLAVRYAAERPGSVAGLVLVDGANPVPEPFVTDSVAGLLRAAWTELAAQQAAREPGYRVVLTADEIFDRNVEIDRARSGILDRYRRIDVPISMIMSTTMAGDTNDAHVARLNRNWRAGAARLARELPGVEVHWVEADHGLVFSHPAEIVRLVLGTRAVGSTG
jgi:pimeloyl-ACP methyl ester carboxylesterase